MKILILTLLLLAPVCISASGATAAARDGVQRRMFWGLAHNRAYACHIAQSQAKHHADGRLGLRLDSLAECVCQTPPPDTHPVDSLLSAAGFAPLVQWNCMVEARFVSND